MGFRFLNSSLSRNLKFCIGLASGIVFFLLAVRNTEFQTTLEIMQSTLLTPILGSLALRLFGLWIRGLRWHILLQPTKDISHLALFRILCIGEMANCLLPAHLGEAIRIIMVSKNESISKVASVTSVILDRALDLLTVIIIFFFFSLFLPFPKWIREVEYIAGFSLIVAIPIGYFLLLWCKRYYTWVSKVISQKFSSLSLKFYRLIIYFFNELSIMQNAWRLLYANAISFLLWGVYSIAFYFVLVSLGIQLPWYASVVTVATVGLGRIIPSAPGTLGTTEFLSVSTLVIFSLDRNAALACAIISHGLQYVVAVSAGLICFFWENVRLRPLHLTEAQIILTEHKL